MPTKKYVLKLSEDERKTLIELLQKGRASGWKLLRAQARQLAECRRAGTERAHASVCGPTNRHPQGNRPGSSNLDPTPQWRPVRHRLAIRHHRRPNQAQAALPENPPVTHY